MPGPRTLHFPAVNKHWTLNVTSGDERSTQPAEGEVTLPADATVFVQAAGELSALEVIPVEMLTGIAASGLGPGQLSVLKDFTAITTLALQGDFTDTDVAELGEDMLGRVTLLTLASNAVTGACFADLVPNPQAVITTFGEGLSDEGMSALLQVRAKWVRTGADVISAELLRSIPELGPEELLLGAKELAVDAFVELVERSPRLTSLTIVDETNEDGDLLGADTVLALRRRRPELTINGSWFDPDAVTRLSSEATASLEVADEASAAEPVELTTQNFDSITAGSTPVLVDFTATWCGPCKQLAPTIHEISGELAGRLVVGTLDIDENKSIAERYGITAIPALLVFAEGRQVARIGARQKQAMYAELAAVL